MSMSHEERQIRAYITSHYASMKAMQEKLWDRFKGVELSVETPKPTTEVSVVYSVLGLHGVYDEDEQAHEIARKVKQRMVHKSTVSVYRCQIK